MKQKKIFIFSHMDLDGVCSCLVVKWAHPTHEVEYLGIGGGNIRDEVKNWLLKHSFADYEKVYFLDMDIADQSDLIDKPNVVIIDHRLSHAEKKGNYKQATALVKEYSSACLLAYRLFKKANNLQLTTPQQNMVAICNDYDSYTLKFPESKMMNYIFWGTQKSFNTFMEAFKDGFNGFNEQQQAIYEIQLREYTRIVNGLNVFESKNIDIDGKIYHIVSAVVNQFINGIADYLFERFNPDIVIIVNTDSDRVSFRRSKKCTLDLSNLAEDLADGGGHAYAAGGMITEDFLEFSKLLEPIKK